MKFGSVDSLSRWQSKRRWVTLLLAIAAWCGVAAQMIGLVNIGHARGWGAAQLLNGFFAYFTNLTNVIVALLLTQHVFCHRLTHRRFQSLDAAAVVYILIVGIVNAIMLRGIWTPHGWFSVGDILCHVILPVAYPIYWLLMVVKTQLPWADALRWLVYPAAFGVASVGRGLYIHWYPYPFFNADRLGIVNVSLVLVFLGALIVLIGAGVIAVDRALCDWNK